MEREKNMAYLLVLSVLFFVTISNTLQGQQSEWLWATVAEGDDDFHVSDIAVDTEGNSYMTGQFGGTVSFDGTDLSADSRSDIFVAKKNVQGQWIWAERVTGSGENYFSSAIAVDNTGNSYITGRFNRNVLFGNIELRSSCRITDKIFIAKISSDGEWLWANKAGGSGVVYRNTGWDIAVDNVGDVYVTGTYIGDASFGHIQLSTGGYPNSNNSFVAKLSSDGAWRWATDTTAAPSRAIAVNNDGSIYVAGSFGFLDEPATFDNITLHSSGGHDAFIAKMSNSGSWLWAHRAGGSEDVKCLNIGVDEIGNCYIAGIFRGQAGFGDISLQSSNRDDLFIAKIDQRGVWQWATQAKGLVSYYTPLWTDSSGNSYVAGGFSGTAAFGDTELQSLGGQDLYAAKLNSDGVWQWVRQGGGETDAQATAVIADELGNCYVAGNFEGSLTIGNERLTTRENIAIFTAKSFITTTDINDDEQPLDMADYIMLGRNYPNPFNPQTAIEFTLNKETDVEISIYNSKGQRVKTLKNRFMPAGTHKAVWNGKDDNGNSLSSGVYFYRLITPQYDTAKRMLLIK